ncbi:hypothetical protein Prudu_021557 [Prunus dulcis]|uniref:Uncharacterized protein n=1 Tax=Prunus dulcis TaxID=3755 RepID=A0A4Y1RXK6_PRUDU|nr:hypothetical protein Prudu_021557 [Prunus dulcis]
MARLGLADLLESNVFTLLDDIRYETTLDSQGVEGVHSGDNGTEMNGLQMRSAPPILAHLETFSQ